jgi:hypothetical protein
MKKDDEDKKGNDEFPQVIAVTESAFKVDWPVEQPAIEAAMELNIPDRIAVDELVLFPEADNSVSANDLAELEAHVAVSDKAYAKIAKLGFDPDEIKAVFGLDTPEVRASWLNGFRGRGKSPVAEVPANGDGKGKGNRKIAIAAP